MEFLILALAVFFLSALGILLSFRSPGLRRTLTLSGVCLGCGLGLCAALRNLFGTPVTEAFRQVWSIPYGAIVLELDALSAFFLVPLFVLAPLAAVYGDTMERADGRKGSRRAGFLPLLLFSICLVFLARHALLFLGAWEAMSIAAYFLIVDEDENEGTQKAGFVFLVAAHLSFAFLLLLFLLLGRESGSYEFADFRLLAQKEGLRMNLVFFLALIGFGTKSGLMPFHVWLPEAHAAAPSHVSALLSGVLVTTGLYGFFRLLGLLGAPPVWVPPVLIAVGLGSALFGIIQALAQDDLKRLLAYSSIENMGLIVLALGVAVWSMRLGSMLVTVVALGAAFFHIWNHAAYKALLFLAAGAVAHETGNRSLDRGGGLAKAMPFTAVFFFLGAFAIAALPPLNGFASEFLLYFAVFLGGTTFPAEDTALVWFVIPGLALVGGLAVLVFIKAFAFTFLGEARAPRPKKVREARLFALLSYGMLAVICGILGLLAPHIVSRLASVLSQASGYELSLVEEILPALVNPLQNWVYVSFYFLFAVGALLGLRGILLMGRKISNASTWACGYLHPNPRMQYTASSFSGAIQPFLRFWLFPKETTKLPRGIFPTSAAFESLPRDPAQEFFYQPFFGGLERVLQRLHFIQHGRLHVYIVYIIAALLACLFWKL